MKLSNVIHLIEALKLFLLEGSEETRGQFSFDFAPLFKFLVSHVLACPKVKFSALTQDEGRNHQRSLQLSSSLVYGILDLTEAVLCNDRVKCSLDFREVRESLLVLVNAINLIQEDLKEECFSKLERIAENDHQAEICLLLSQTV
mmetsp:Transcript_13543/g.21112  ORF Transcript_13543/g.21112 Transcript_13543/m.21112 type:complete len:145 (-) Transcript_13543:10496-10930(-)